MQVIADLQAQVDEHKKQYDEVSLLDIMTLICMYDEIPLLMYDEIANVVLLNSLFAT